MLAARCGAEEPAAAGDSKHSLRENLARGESTVATYRVGWCLPLILMPSGTRSWSRGCSFSHICSFGHRPDRWPSEGCTRARRGCRATTSRTLPLSFGIRPGDTQRTSPSRRASPADRRAGTLQVVCRICLAPKGAVGRRARSPSPAIPPRTATGCPTPLHGRADTVHALATRRRGDAPPPRHTQAALRKTEQHAVICGAPLTTIRPSGGRSGGRICDIAPCRLADLQLLMSLRGSSRWTPVAGPLWAASAPRAAALCAASGGV